MNRKGKKTTTITPPTLSVSASLGKKTSLGGNVRVNRENRNRCRWQVFYFYPAYNLQVPARSQHHDWNVFPSFFPLLCHDAVVTVHFYILEICCIWHVVLYVQLLHDMHKPAQKKSITLSLRPLPTELVMCVGKKKLSQRLCFMLQHVRVLWFSIMFVTSRTGMCAKFILFMVWTHALLSIQRLVLISQMWSHAASQQQQDQKIRKSFIAK